MRKTENEVRTRMDQLAAYLGKCQEGIYSEADFCRLAHMDPRTLEGFKKGGTTISIIITEG